MCSQRQKSVEEDATINRAIQIFGRRTPSPTKGLTLTTSRLKLGKRFGRANTIVRGENNADEQAFEAQGVQELGRAYAGLVITRAAAQRVRAVVIEPKTLGLRRNRKSVADFLHTHT
jgi:uncharacterized membrane protein